MNCPAFSLGTSQNKSPKAAAPGNSQVSRRPQLSALGSSLHFHTPCWYIGGSKPLHPHMSDIWMPQSAVARSRVGCVAAASWRGVWTLGMPVSRRSIRFARKKKKAEAEIKWTIQPAFVLWKSHPPCERTLRPVFQTGFSSCRWEAG